MDVHGAYRALLLHTYRRSWVSPLGAQTRLFEQIAAILARVPVYRLVRPEAKLDAEALVRLVEEGWT
jgi:hypothetical protein